MWISLEILVPDKKPGALPDFRTDEITVIESTPPQSHRDRSSIWQEEFRELGGVLFHLGDPKDIKIRSDRYYLYDAFEPRQSSSVFVKFLPKYEKDFEKIVYKLCNTSGSGKIFLTLDVWLGPKAIRYKNPVSFDAFIEIYRRRGLRKNSFREIQL